MVITLQIDKIESGMYRAAVLFSGTEITYPGTYPSIEDAIMAEADELPDGFAYFANVTYGGASSGTISLAALPSRAAQVADQLVAIVAEKHAIG